MTTKLALAQSDHIKWLLLSGNGDLFFGAIFVITKNKIKNK